METTTNLKLYEIQKNGSINNIYPKQEETGNSI